MLTSFPAHLEVTSWYCKCPLHGTSTRSCSKQLSKGTRDEIIRYLMYWLLQGKEFQMYWLIQRANNQQVKQLYLFLLIVLHLETGFNIVRAPAETNEEIRSRHVHKVVSWLCYCVYYIQFKLGFRLCTLTTMLMFGDTVAKS